MTINDIKGNKDSKRSLEYKRLNKKYYYSLLVN